MGSERYIIWLIPEDTTTILDENGFRHLEGYSKILLSEVENAINNNKFPVKKIVGENGYYLIDNLFEVFISKKENKFQALYICGSMSWFEDGLEELYSIIDHMKKTFRFKIETQGQLIQFNDFQTFKDQILILNQGKYQNHKRIYKNFKARISPSEYYRYYNKNIRTFWDKIFNK